MFPHTFPACFLKADLPPCWIQPASFYLCCFPLTHVRVNFDVLSMLPLLSRNFLWLAPAMLWRQWLHQTGTLWCAVLALPRALMASPTDDLLVTYLCFSEICVSYQERKKCSPCECKGCVWTPLTWGCLLPNSASGAQRCDLTVGCKAIMWTV